MKKNIVLLFGFLLICLVSLSHQTIAIEYHKNPENNMTKFSPEERFDLLLKARDEEFEKQRVALFSDAEATAYMKTRIADSDRVIGFISRVLYQWATTPPPEFAKAEDFLIVGIFANKEKMSRTVQGWNGSVEIELFLKKESNDLFFDFFLLQALKRPNRPYILDGLDGYASFHPISEPEALIRAYFEEPNRDPSSEYGLNGLKNNVLAQIGERRALDALTHERNYFKTTGRKFPANLEMLYQKLREWERDPRRSPPRKKDDFFKTWKWGWEPD